MQLLDRLLETERQLWTNKAPLFHDVLLEDALLSFPETDIISDEEVDPRHL